jgi:hypothetical protein
MKKYVRPESERRTPSGRPIVSVRQGRKDGGWVEPNMQQIPGHVVAELFFEDPGSYYGPALPPATPAEVLADIRGF